MTALRRTPFTTSVVVVMVVMGVATSAFWQAVNTSPWWERLAYGLPALEAGRWWTPVTGALLATEPLQYLPILGGFALMVGFAEHRLGTAAAALAAVAGQLLGVVGAAAVLAVGRSAGWGWAASLAGELDVGFSAGALCALTVAAYSLRRPWRGRLLFGIGVYCVGNLVLLGVLWDVEHAIAVLLGVAVGRLRVAPRRPPEAPAAARDLHALAAGTALGIALCQLGLVLLPTDGPLGPSPLQDARPGAVGTLTALLVLLAAALVTGRRVAWRAGFAVVAAGVGGAALLSGVPQVTGVAAYALLAAVLVRARPAYGVVAAVRRVAADR